MHHWRGLSAGQTLLSGSIEEPAFRSRASIALATARSVGEGREERSHAQQCEHGEHRTFPGPCRSPTKAICCRIFTPPLPRPLQ